MHNTWGGMHPSPAWMLLVPRLVERGHLPDEEGLAERILAVGPR